MYKHFIKRLLDIVFSFIILIFGIPFILIGAILIKLDSKGPIFFKQPRIGKDNKEFTVYKLRTMDLVVFDENGKRRKDKDRITKSGRIIRKLSLDELPQLVNVFLGDMSFVGPRPLLVRYYPYYTDEELRRHEVRPGITGLAQINGRSNLLWEERFAYDVQYVDNLTFLLDMKIVFNTFMKVFRGSDTGVSDRPKNLVDFDVHRKNIKLR